MRELREEQGASVPLADPTRRAQSFPVAPSTRVDVTVRTPSLVPGARAMPSVFGRTRAPPP
jgi:hypothetical protein